MSFSSEKTTEIRGNIKREEERKRSKRGIRSLQKFISFHKLIYLMDLIDFNCKIKILLLALFPHFLASICNENDNEYCFVFFDYLDLVSIFLKRYDFVDTSSSMIKK